MTEIAYTIHQVVERSIYSHDELIMKYNIKVRNTLNFDYQN